MTERVKAIREALRYAFQKYDIEKLARRIDQQTDEKHLEKPKRRRALDNAGRDTDTALELLAELIIGKEK